MISILQTRDIELDEWQRLSNIGAHIGNTGAPLSCLWAWSLTYSGSAMLQESGSSQALQDRSGGDATGKGSGSRLWQCLAQSQPLARRSLWPVRSTQQK